jgi:hypothetical protein
MCKNQQVLRAVRGEDPFAETNRQIFFLNFETHFSPLSLLAFSHTISSHY